MNFFANIKEKYNELYHKSRTEILRLMTIARHMFTASQVSTELSKCYSDLGHLAANALESKELEWSNHHVQSLLQNIKELSQKLELMENEVSKAKFAPFENFFKK